MANPSFVDALSNLRRKAQLSGRPLTKQEMAGAVAGYAETAADRLAKARALDIEQERLRKEKKSEKWQYEVARKAEERAEKQEEQSKSSSYIQAGAQLGYNISGGSALGIVAGGVVGWIASECMIISACNGPNSYEVNVSREFRDHYMTVSQLIGYYAMAPFISKLINKNDTIKRITKNYLIDFLVDYGEWILHKKPTMKRPFLSKWISRGFLKLCKIIGKIRKFHEEKSYAK